MARLAELDMSKAEVSRRDTGQKDALQRILKGHRPSIDRVAAIAEVLGLELCVRTPSSEHQNLSNTPPKLRIAPPPDELDIEALAADWAETRERSEAVLDALRRQAEREPRYPLAEPEAPDARPVQMPHLAAAAGAGAVDLDAVDSEIFLWFRRSWLDRMGLDPTQCLVIDVRGESMEPTLPEGCSLLVNRAQHRRLIGKLFVVNADTGLVVKRAGKDSEGHWLLESDHPAWDSVSWPDDAELIGQVRWMARTL